MENCELFYVKPVTHLAILYADCSEFDRERISPLIDADSFSCRVPLVQMEEKEKGVFQGHQDIQGPLGRLLLCRQVILDLTMDLILLELVM